MTASKFEELSAISTKDLETELRKRAGGDQPRFADLDPSAINSLMASPLLAGGTMQGALARIFFSALHKIPEPEDWKTVFDGTTSEASTTGDPVTSTSEDGCVIITIPATWIYETRIIGIPRGRVFTIENTGGGSTGGGISILGSGATASGPVRLYQVVEYVIGPVFHYAFIVKGSITITMCPGKAPDTSRTATGGAWSLTHMEPEGLIGAPVMRSGGLEDHDQAAKIRRALLNQTPGAVTSNSKLGLRDG